MSAVTSAAVIYLYGAPPQTPAPSLAGAPTPRAAPSQRALCARSVHREDVVLSLDKSTLQPPGTVSGAIEEAVEIRRGQADPAEKLGSAHSFAVVVGAARHQQVVPARDRKKPL